MPIVQEHASVRIDIASFGNPMDQRIEWIGDDFPLSVDECTRLLEIAGIGILSLCGSGDLEASGSRSILDELLKYRHVE